MIVWVAEIIHALPEDVAESIYDCWAQGHMILGVYGSSEAAQEDISPIIDGLSGWEPNESGNYIEAVGKMTLFDTSQQVYNLCLLQFDLNGGLDSFEKTIHEGYGIARFMAPLMMAHDRNWFDD